MRLFQMPFFVLALCVFTVEIEKAIERRPEVRKLFELAQTKRASFGIARQTLDADCCKQAQRWAERMAAADRMQHGGGEQIIAVGPTTSAGVLRVWLNSPPHKSWIFCKRLRCGFGCAKSKSGRTYWAGVYKNKNPKTK